MRIVAIVALLVSFSASASITEGGRGVLFGADHAFAITAIPGWVLDNQSAVGQNLHMVFYPKGESWSNSPAIIYGVTIPTATAVDVTTHVESTVNQFRSNGSPHYTSKKMPPLSLRDGRKAALYFYSGDQWGNHEAAAYFPEADTINYLVFNSRTKEGFDNYLGDFLQITRSYQNLYRPATEVTAKKLADLRRESSAVLEVAGGKEYEAKAAQAVVQAMANIMVECSSYLDDKKPPSFSYFVRIDTKGEVIESNVYPTNALSACFSSLMSDAHYPTHTFARSCSMSK